MQRWIVTSQFFHASLEHHSVDNKKRSRIATQECDFPEIFNVVVVDGGPAGLATALGSSRKMFKTVLLGTGVGDVMPASLSGYQENWGKLNFHCLFCHEFEERGTEHAGVHASESSTLTQKDLAIAVAKTVKGFADQAEKICPELTPSLTG